MCRSRNHVGSDRRFYRAAAASLAVACLAVTAPHPALAQQTITEYTLGPISGADSSITVTSSGTVDGGVFATLGDTTTTLTNAGLITGEFTIDVGSGGSIDTLINSGTISGSDKGMQIQSGGIVTSASNSGLFQGGNQAIFVDGGGQLGTLTNVGSMQSPTQAVYVIGTIGTVSNSGTMSGDVFAVGVSGSVAQLTNTGVVSSPDTAVLIDGGVLTTLSNSGLITGGNYAFVVTNGGQIGTLANSGTIGSILVQGQDLTITGGTGGAYGAFTGGINVANGSLTFASGNTRLGADVAVSGTMINQGNLLLSDARSLTAGDFSQSSAGTFVSLLNGTGVGEYGSLTIGGAATFSGILGLEQGSLSLAAGQIFDLFFFSSATGGFSGLSVDGTLLSSLGGLQWAFGSYTLTEVWDETSMKIQVTAGGSSVPEIDPAGLSGVMALVAGALGLLERRRMKAA